MVPDLTHWSFYNEHQSSRVEHRAILTRALRIAGNGRGRVALDLGSGAGVETRALLDRGWVVHAFDYDGSAMARLIHPSQQDARRLHRHVVDLADLERLPPADFIFSAYALSWLDRPAFYRVWHMLLASLLPNALLAVNVFGDRDDYASVDGTTCLSEDDLRILLAELSVVDLRIQDEQGPSFSGSKHWHVYDVLAIRPGDASAHVSAVRASDVDDGHTH